jgi:hypothetical protein
MDDVGSNLDDDCDGSICSIRSLISKDFNYRNDDRVVETTLTNREPVVDDEIFSRLHNIPMSGTTGYYPRVSQRSISTEMTIIASTSPEIKALGGFPITPNFPNEVNFESFHRRQGSLDSLFSVDSDSVASIVERPFHTPMRTDSQSEYDGNGLSQFNTVTPQDCNANEEESAFMEEADALCIVMKKQNLGSEGIEDRMQYNHFSSLNSRCASFEQRIKIPRGHGCRHMTSPSLDRLSMHRRVSFSSLPSPAEIASPEIASRPAHSPFTPRRAASCNNIRISNGSACSPSNNMDLTS